MHSGPIKNVLLVHGYSVRTLHSWGRLPALLKAAGFDASAIFLSAFVSLDDYVSCDDLAVGLEHKIAALETGGLDLGKTAVICHSTGAIITRRWVLNRRKAGKPTPSHLITAAGANHGSTMAQLGRTELAYIFRDVTEQTSVGKRVLEDLDYGSPYLRKLNRDWLDAWNDANAPLWQDVYSFSMIGTDHSYWKNQVVPQAHEPGSDGTVRISGGNLNYRFIDIVPPYTAFNTITMDQPAPHLVVETPEKRYSHTSQSDPDTLGLVLSKVATAASSIAHFGLPAQQVSSTSYGILEGIATPDERPFRALTEAFAVQDDAAYRALASTWGGETDTWSQAHTEDANSTIVVAIRDDNGRVVDDSMVLIRDEDRSIQNLTASLRGPVIKNEDTPSVRSFYINTDTFRGSHPHYIYVEAQTDTPYVQYSVKIDAQISGGAEHSVEANQFTYVDIQALRDPSGAFAFVSFADPKYDAILDTVYPPLPQGT